MALYDRSRPTLEDVEGPAFAGAAAESKKGEARGAPADGRRADGNESWTPRDGHHYTVFELAEEWNLSTDYVRRVFAREPGVLVFMRQRPGRRAYRVLRIPAAVAQRIYRRSQIA